MKWKIAPSFQIELTTCAIGAISFDAGMCVNHSKHSSRLDYIKLIFS